MTTDLVGGRLGKYEIRSEIGRGGAAIVYRAYDPDLNRDVAIKVLSPLLAQNQAVVERFRREARSAALLDHPNIVTIHDVGKDGDWHYIVMHLLEGETLTEIIRHRAPLPPEEVLSILHPLAQALDYAHSRGVVHRDVKPSNIIVSPTGHVTMTDFGIALAAHEKRITATGAIVGTPDYMSPEQVEGLEIDGRSDQYSLGIIAYEMLSGRLPFEGTGPGNLLYKIVHEKTPPIGLIKSDLPEPVGKVLEQVLSKKAKDRYATTEFFVEVLDLAITPARSPAKASRVRRGAEPARPRKRIPGRAWMTLVAAVLIVLVIILLIAAGRQDAVEMIQVPAGEFVMGSDTGESYERPTHVVYVNEFWIDNTEVTNAQFAEFVEATDYQTEVESKGGFLYGPEGRVLTPGADWRHPQGPDSDLTGLEDHPVVLVSWNDAAAYCEWRGARLPTEAEWEKAARGDDERTHPWGEGVDASRLNYCDSRCPFDWRVNDQDDGYRFTAPVGSYPAGAGPYGALDMAGNVREWVSDWYDPGYYASSPERDPSGPSLGELKVARGSAWNDVEWTIHATDRYYYLPHFGGNEVGFRCAGGAP